jgi:UDP-N-acetylmuramyl pentapeptide synthase
VPYDSNREQIQTKIIDILNTSKHKDLNIINREISIFSLPLTSSVAITNITSAIEFLEYLKANKKQLASQRFTLSANYEFINS